MNQGSVVYHAQRDALPAIVQVIVSSAIQLEDSPSTLQFAAALPECTNQAHCATPAPRYSSSVPSTLLLAAHNAHRQLS